MWVVEILRLLPLFKSTESSASRSIPTSGIDAGGAGGATDIFQSWHIVPGWLIGLAFRAGAAVYSSWLALIVPDCQSLRLLSPLFFSFLFFSSLLSSPPSTSIIPAAGCCEQEVENGIISVIYQLSKLNLNSDSSAQISEPLKHAIPV